MASEGFNKLFGAQPVKKSTSLLDRFANNLTDTFSGAVPGMLEIGSTIAADATNLATGARKPFRFDNLAKDMGTGFAQNSWIPGLITGGPGEALKRANARPLDAILDATMIFPALKGAGMASARAGHHMGNDALKTWGTDILGLKQTTTEFADMFRAESEGGFLKQDNLPGLVDFMGGESKPMREFIPENTNDMKKYGDELWLRQTKRTMPLGKIELTANTPEKELDVNSAASAWQEKYKASQDPARDSLYADDEWRRLTSYRAQNEGMAKIGDFVSDLTSKIPESSKFGPTARIGRRRTQLEMRDMMLENDQASIDHSDVMKKLRDYASTIPAMQHLDQEGIDGIAGLKEWARSNGVTEDNLDAMQARVDPTYGGLEHEELRAVPMAELEKYGYSVQSTLGGRADDAYAYNTFGEFLDDKADLIGRRTPDEQAKLDSPYRFKRLSEAHRAARTARDEARQKAVDQLNEYRNHSEIGAPFLREYKTGNEMDVPEKLEDFLHMITPSGNDKPAWMMDFRELPNNETFSPDVWSETQRRHKETFNEHLSSFKEADSLARNFDEHSDFELHNIDLLHGKINPAPGQSEPGISKVFQKIRSPEYKALDENSPQVRAFLELNQRFRDKGLEYSKDIYEGLLTPERVAANRDRGTELLGSAEEGAFFPMQKPSGTLEGRYRTPLGEAGVQFRPIVDKAPGDPMALLLSGEFRHDSKVMVDDFQKTRQRLAGQRLFGGLNSMAMSISPAEAEKMMASGQLMKGVDVGKTKSSSPFTWVDRKDLMSQDLENFDATLAQMQQSLGNSPQAKIVADLRRHMVTQFDIDPTNGPVGVNRTHPEARGLQEPDDVIKIIPTEIYRAAIQEMKDGQLATRGFLKMVAEPWKYMVLHTRFLSWMRNNIVGAHLMALFAMGPGDYITNLARMANRSQEQRDIIETIEARNPDVISANGSASLSRDLGVGDTDIGGIKGGWNNVKQKFNWMSDLNNAVADAPPRVMHIMGQMDDQLEMAAKLSGKPRAELTPEIVENFMNDETLRQQMALRTNTTFVDFADMSEMEKKWLTSIFPFWAWMKGSTLAGQRLAADKPGTMSTIGAIGELGTEELQDQHGMFVPDFAKTMWDPGEAGGMMINTSGWNPYGTPFQDIPAMAAGLVPDLIPGDKQMDMSYRQYGSENLFAGTNPLLGGLAQGALGRNAFFGTPLPNDSLGSTLLNTQAGLPLITLIDKLARNNTSPDATSVTSRPMTIMQYLGSPVIDPRWSALHERSVDELNERYRTPAAIHELVQ